MYARCDHAGDLIAMTSYGQRRLDRPGLGSEKPHTHADVR